MMTKLTDGSTVVLLNHGDVTSTMLMDWCITQCMGKGSVKLTLCLPYPTAQTMKYVLNHAGLDEVDVLCQDSGSVDEYLLSDGTGHMSSDGMKVRVAASPFIRTQCAVVRGDKHAFVLIGNLLQAKAAGKTMTVLRYGDNACREIEQVMESWMRLYGRE